MLRIIVGISDKGQRWAAFGDSMAPEHELIEVVKDILSGDVSLYRITLPRIALLKSRVLSVEPLGSVTRPTRMPEPRWERRRHEGS